MFRSALVPGVTVLAAALVVGFPSLAPAQSLRGSRESIDRMYHQAVAEGLSFSETTARVRRQAADGRLVRLTSDGTFRLHRVSLPYVRPATRTFVRRLAAQYVAACGERLVVTSAVRPTTRQPANSVDRSVHPTGMAIDLRKPASGRCLGWLRETLLDLERAGVLEATEEWSPPHFHVAVFAGPYLRYAGSGSPAPARAPSIRTYVVRRGETLWKIARVHRTTVDAITAANYLEDGRPIRPGQRLRIPVAAAGG